jgi:hypothetical protein
MADLSFIVVPAKAGTIPSLDEWIPAFAGMTI